MAKMGYNPAGAASCLARQGKSAHPHGPGGLPPAPKGSDGGRNVKYSPAGAASHLRGQSSKAPNNHGPGAGKTC